MEIQLAMTGEWQPRKLRTRGADSSGVFIRAYSARVDARLGGVGDSAVLRAIRAVSSASRARALVL